MSSPTSSAVTPITTRDKPRQTNIDKYLRVIEDELGYRCEWKITVDMHLVVHACNDRKAVYSHGKRRGANNTEVDVYKLPLHQEGDVYFVRVERRDRSGVMQFYKVLVDWFM